MVNTEWLPVNYCMTQLPNYFFPQGLAGYE